MDIVLDFGVTSCFNIGYIAVGPVLFDLLSTMPKLRRLPRRFVGVADTTTEPPSAGIRLTRRQLHWRP
jgi:hypothetical protein